MGDGVAATVAVGWVVGATDGPVDGAGDKSGDVGVRWRGGRPESSSDDRDAGHEDKRDDGDSYETAVRSQFRRLL